MVSPQSDFRGAPPMQRGAWLDFLRFAVAGLIIIHHYHASGPVDLSTVHPVFDRGFILTNFFLLDSGYVLARIYANRIGVRMTYGEFVRKRFLRLWPGHLVILGGLVAMYFLAELLGVSPTHARWFDWSQFPAQLFLVQSYGVPGGLGWNAPTWSISALLGCYLTFPLLIKLFYRLPPWTTLALGVGIYLLADLLTHIFLGLPVYEMPMKYGFLRALPLFMMGVVLARFSERVYIAPRIACVLGLGAFAAIVLAQGMGKSGLATMGLIGVIVVAAGAIPVAKPSKFIEFGALAAFAIFISNEVVRIGYFGVAEQVIRRFGLGVEMQWALWLGGVLSAFIFAFAFYQWFDKPTQAWFNRSKRAEKTIEVSAQNA
jgi:peptidoglycan/LPS O-acetylase OafA/YrhL